MFSLLSSQPLCLSLMEQSIRISKKLFLLFLILKNHRLYNARSMIKLKSINEIENCGTYVAVGREKILKQLYYSPSKGSQHDRLVNHNTMERKNRESTVKVVSKEKLEDEKIPEKVGLLSTIILNRFQDIFRLLTYLLHILFISFKRSLLRALLQIKKKNNTALRIKKYV